MVLRHASYLLVTFAASALLTATASAQTLTDRLDEPAERILSKHGVDIDGKMEAQYFHSGLDGTAKVDTNYGFETSQFTYFDLGMQYRAFDWITAKADLRFYQDWQTFFATRSRILAARWLSVDGNIANTLAFNAGDFHQKYSHLTLWSPELEMTYEPEIFARMRRDLMADQYINDNDRVLQGVNLNFARRFDGPLNEVRVDGIGSRLRRGEYLDSNGYQGHQFAKSDMDRFLAGANAEAFVKSNLYLGGSYLTLIDDRESFRQSLKTQEFQDLIHGDPDNNIPAAPGWSMNDRDSVIARDLRITSGRAGADVAGFLGNENLVLEFTGEYAMSHEANRFAWHFKPDTTGGVHYVSTEGDAPGKDGKALLFEMEAGFRSPDSLYSVNLSGAYLKNDAAFLNPLAQSPTFSGARIMNTENDFGDGRLYSAFDALYNGVYKFSPSSRQSNGMTAYQQAPISKTSYNNGVLSPEDLKGFSPEPLLQMTLPFGYATPNRTGPVVNLSASWRNTVHASIDAALLKEVEGSVFEATTLPPASLSRMGGGLMVEAGKFIGTRALDVSASFTRNELKRDRSAKDLGDPNATADLAMAGLRWKFLKKWGFLAGFQQATISKQTLVTEGEPANAKVKHVYQYRQDDTQNHIRAGLEYSLTRNAYVLVSGGLISVDRGLVNQGTTANAAGPVTARNSQKDFTQTLSQAVIKVGF